MVKVELYKELEKHVVFNAKKVSEVTIKSKGYARLLIHRLQRSGLINKIEKDKYTTYNDPFLVASHIVWPSYISCWSAVRYYNLTEQLPNIIHVITTRSKKRKRIKFKGAELVFIKVKKDFFYGYGKVIYRDFEIFVADKEKALIDSAVLKKISFSQLMRIIKENKREIDFGKLITCLLKSNNTTAIKRFGYLFDKLNVECEALAKSIDKNYVPLDYCFPGKGRKNSKWKVIVNVRI